MPHGLDRTQQRQPEWNHGLAVAKALEWLGDRYLLAKPINARVRFRKPTAKLEHHQTSQEESG